MSSQKSGNSAEAPSLLASHAKYAAGAAKETIGNLTGSDEWKTTGQQDKDSAVKDMRAANEASSAQPGVGGIRVGKMEESLGSAVGCEGMVSEGQQKQNTQ